MKQYTKVEYGKIHKSYPPIKNYFIKPQELCRKRLEIIFGQLDLIDIYRTFHPKTMNFTFFSSAHGTFSRIDNILGHKSSLGKFKKIETQPLAPVPFLPRAKPLRRPAGARRSVGKFSGEKKLSGLVYAENQYNP